MLYAAVFLIQNRHIFVIQSEPLERVGNADRRSLCERVGLAGVDLVDNARLADKVLTNENSRVTPRLCRDC